MVDDEHDDDADASEETMIKQQTRTYLIDSNYVDLLLVGGEDSNKNARRW